MSRDIFPILLLNAAPQRPLFLRLLKIVKFWRFQKFLRNKKIIYRNRKKSSHRGQYSSMDKISCTIHLIGLKHYVDKVFIKRTRDQVVRKHCFQIDSKNLIYIDYFTSTKAYCVFNFCRIG